MKTASLARATVATASLCAAWVLVVAMRDAPERTRSLECGTDPREIFRIGERLEAGNLRFIVEAHCAQARYLPDERIELRYAGETIHVQTSRLGVEEPSTYYEIVSVRRARR